MEQKGDKAVGAANRKRKESSSRGETKKKRKVKRYDTQDPSAMTSRPKTLLLSAPLVHLIPS